MRRNTHMIKRTKEIKKHMIYLLLVVFGLQFGLSFSVPVSAEEIKGNGHSAQSNELFDETQNELDALCAKRGAPVTVIYTANGVEIAESKTLTGRLKRSYKATAKTIDHYKLIETPSNAKGTFQKEPQLVEFKYEGLPAEPLTVHFQDTKGNTLKPDKVKEGKYGEPFNLEQDKVIYGYTLVDTQGDAAGTFSDKAQSVTFIYERAQGGSVTAHYQDVDGKQIANDEIQTGNIGDKFKFDERKIAGYTLKEIHGEPRGTFTAEPKEITFVYTSSKSAPVTAHYKDTDGKEIAKDEIKTGNLGDSFEFSKKEIKGYTWKETIGNAKGTFSDQAQEVTFIYKKEKGTGSVNVRYQNESGREIHAGSKITGEIGTPYYDDLMKKKITIEDYTFHSVKGNTQGKYSKTPRTIILIYKAKPKKKANMAIYYVDKATGDPIPGTKPKTMTGVVGTKVTITPPAIKGYKAITPKKSYTYGKDKTVRLMYEKL